MSPDFVPEMRALGPRLLAAARAMQTARQQTPAWLAPLARMLARVAQPALANPERFARVEARELSGLDAPLAPSPASPGGQGLPGHVRERLRAPLGPAVDRLRVHDDEAADRLARGHGADALSMGADVFFARGRYRPHDSAGLALLAHEAVHVAQALRPDAAWQRSGGAALAAEEAQAQAVERAMRRGESLPSLPPRTARAPAPVAAPLAAAAAAAPAAQRPMAAAAERALTDPGSGPALDLEALKQSLMRDLLSQIRSDMERGG